jgi:hypothetical protein
MTLPDPSMKRGIRPFDNSLAISVLYRIEMNVVEMRPQIFLVANPVFPESALPYAGLAPTLPTCAACSRCRKLAREATFDHAPAHGIVDIAFRHVPECMHVFRQNHPRDHFERHALTRLSHRTAKIVDTIDQQRRGAIAQRDGKKVRPARGPVASIVRHGEKAVAAQRSIVPRTQKPCASPGFVGCR